VLVLDVVGLLGNSKLEVNVVKIVAGGLELGLGAEESTISVVTLTRGGLMEVVPDRGETRRGGGVEPREQMEATRAVLTDEQMVGGLAGREEWNERVDGGGASCSD